jgi:site-specific recombinase XerD
MRSRDREVPLGTSAALSDTAGQDRVAARSHSVTCRATRPGVSRRTAPHNFELEQKSVADQAAAGERAPRVCGTHKSVEMLLRTGLRVSEFTGLPADAVVLIGAGPWLHVPAGKLREDRYLPLHPQLVTLIDGYRAAHVPAGHPLLLPRENGRPLDRNTVTRMINKAGTAARLPHIHPQLRHTLATQAINRGMSLEAIAALLGSPQPGHDLRYAKIASRTVADEYFSVTEKVKALYGQPTQLPRRDRPEDGPAAP